MAHKKATGSTKNGRDYVNLKLTHAEMADLVGSNREAVSATLSKWKQAGVVEIIKGYAVIKNPDRLSEFATA